MAHNNIDDTTPYIWDDNSKGVVIRDPFLNEPVPDYISNKPYPNFTPENALDILYHLEPLNLKTEDISHLSEAKQKEYKLYLKEIEALEDKMRTLLENKEPKKRKRIEIFKKKEDS